MAFATLELRQAEVIRDGRRLLGPIDLTLDSGGITVILGHNGAGKSLFVKMCHGLFAPDRGTVLWNGRPATATRQERGFLFQTTPLLRRSVRANIEFPLLALGIPRAGRRKKVEAALQQARLDTRANAPAGSLSGGERQRLALARAAVGDPPVILMDEPSASLDPASTKELETAVRSIVAAGTKVFLVTHDIHQAKRLAGDVLMFADGALLAHEPADSFFTRPHNGAIADFLEGRL